MKQSIIAGIVSGLLCLGIMGCDNSVTSKPVSYLYHAIGEPHGCLHYQRVKIPGVLEIVEPARVDLTDNEGRVGKIIRFRIESYFLPHKHYNIYDNMPLEPATYTPWAQRYYDDNILEVKTLLDQCLSFNYDDWVFLYKDNNAYKKLIEMGSLIEFEYEGTICVSPGNGFGEGSFIVGRIIT